MTRLIDAHVHFFSGRDIARVASTLPYALPAPHTLEHYLDNLIDHGRKPSVVHNVHLSILPDSENIYASFAELDALQKSRPERYGGIEITGTILADPAYATAERLAHPKVKGIRIVLHDARPDQTGDYSTPEWRSLFARLRPDQHLHVYAQDPQVNLKVLRQVPDTITVAIDHLGTCFPDEADAEAAHVALVLAARERGGVIFKGPGYRTASTSAAALPVLQRIVADLGPEHVLLQASDGPHVGKDRQGRSFADLFTPVTAFDYVAELAELAAQPLGLAPQRLLHGAESLILP